MDGGMVWIGYSRTTIPYPHHPTIHAIPYFLVGIICGPIWGSFAVRDHLRSWDHLRTRTYLSLHFLR